MPSIASKPSASGLTRPGAIVKRTNAVIIVASLKPQGVIAFGETCAAIAATASRLEKTALVAHYLSRLAESDLAPAARYFTGNPFPAAEERSLTIGGRTIVAAAAQTWGIDDAALAAAYRATGDLGAALGPFVRPAQDLGLFAERLTPAALYARLIDIADAGGKHAQKRRRVLCERILCACTDALEATYVIKIMTGELRIGLREAFVIEAIAQAFGRSPPLVRRAAAAAGDLGAVALAAKSDTLAAVTIVYHAPLAFMLASPLAYSTEYAELSGGSWQVEDKYDGIRAQAHITPERVSLFSRTLRDVAAAYPEVVAALRAVPASYMLDGELIAMREGHVLPFRLLQRRLQRKDVSADLLRDVPVRYVAFDVLARGDEFFLDLPLATRRTRLEALLEHCSEALSVAPAVLLPSDAVAELVHEHFEASRVRGHEGVMLKRSDAPYTPGRRGKAWLKLKRELATLDCVVVAVERGHGRRHAVLSDYTFAVRDGDALAVIGKAYGGLTDAEIVAMTAWFEAHRLPQDEAQAAYERLALGRHETVVQPEIIVEIAFDIIARSSLHASGYALRFPRIVRLRPDKSVADIDTLDSVAAIYAGMLAREALQ